jgi:hypothetical protein
MKINQLLSGISIALTNAEQQFVESHGKSVRLASLDDHNRWVAQSLVRKGVYDISRDSTTLINKLHETYT